MSRDWLFIVAFVIGYLLLNRWILPRLGVAT